MEKSKKNVKKETVKKKIVSKKVEPNKTKAVTKKPAAKTNTKKVVVSKEPVVIKKLDSNNINNLSLLIQAVLTTYALLLLVGGLFHQMFLDIFDAVISMLLFVIAYNNHKVFKHRRLTAVYIIAGIIFAGIFLYGIFN